METTFMEYQCEARGLAMYPDKMYPVASLMVEAAELADLFVKPYLRGDDVDVDKKEVIKEAGDVLWMLSNILSDMDIELEDVARANIRKLKDRAERGVIQGSGGNR